MNKRKGFFRLTLILSFLCGIFALYFPNDVFEDPAFRNGNVKITLPSDWGGKSVQEKLDLVNNLDINLRDWEKKKAQEYYKEREEKLNKKNKEREKIGLPPLHHLGLPHLSDLYPGSIWGGYNENLLLNYYYLSPREKQKVKKKLKEEIISYKVEDNPTVLYEGLGYRISLGRNYIKTSLLILKAFIIGFALVWIIYAVIRWVLIGFIAGGFKDRSTP